VHDEKLVGEKRKTLHEDSLYCAFGGKVVFGYPPRKGEIYVDTKRLTHLSFDSACATPSIAAAMSFSVDVSGFTTRAILLKLHLSSHSA
jgi:hypothetical protein